MLKRLFEMPQSLISGLQASRSIKNTFWTLVAGVWTGLLIVLATPWYVARVGLAGYGLLGLWLMLQVMMALLDLGLGATLVREFADSREHRSIFEYKRDLLRTLERFYWAIATIITLAILLASGGIATHWLKSQSLPSSYVSHTIGMMAIALGLQFPNTLYANGLIGLQRHGRMSALQVLGSSLRYGGGIAVLFWRADLVWFFAVQAVVAAIQTFVTRVTVWRLISEPGARRPVFRPEMMRRIWRFSVGMALTSISAVLLGNADRVVLSKMMPTVELGKYAVAFTATGLLQMGIQPFYRAFFPRFSELVSLGDPGQLRGEYYRSCRLMAVVLLPVGILGWVFAPQLFYVWMGRTDSTIPEVFRWLLVGIVSSGLMWLPAAFQQAHGWTRLHVGMMTGALILGTPIMVWAIRDFGTVGATTVWVLHGVSDLTLGLWLMHRRLLIGEMFEWYRKVVLPPLLVALPLVALSRWLMPAGLGRGVSLGWIMGSGLAVVLLALVLSFGKRQPRVHAEGAGLLGE